MLSVLVALAVGAFGATVSRLITISWLLVPPALVAVHLRVVPAVSALMMVCPQPVDEEIADSLSVTVQLTVTSPTYQLLVPNSPSTLGVMVGAEVSVGCVATGLATV